MSRTIVTGLVAAFVMAALFLFTTLREDTRPADDVHLKSEAPGTSTAPAPSVAVPDRAGSLSTGDVPIPTTREPIDSLALQVIDVDGRPLAGAEATWTPLLPELVAVLRRELPRDYAALDARSSSATSDGDGNLKLKQLAAEGLAVPTVLFITHPGHESFHALLAANEGLAKVVSPIRLRPDPWVPVKVVHSDGTPAASATVHCSLRITRREATQGTELKQDALRVGHRTAITNAEGVALVAPGPYVYDVVAELGALRSAPAPATPPDGVTLRLVTCFQLEGRVVVAENAARFSECKIIVRPWLDSIGREWKQFAVRGDGTFGPVVVPLDDCNQLAVTLEGGGFVQLTELFPRPNPSELVRVELHPVQGIALTFRTVDEKSTNVSNASVAVFWQDKTGWVEVAGLTAEEGLVRLQGIQPGSMYFRTTCAGFVERNDGPVSYPEEQAVPVLLALERGGILKGRVTHKGQPVRRFSLLAWEKDVRYNKEYLSDGNADGTFVWDGVPLGDQHVFAMTNDLPRSDVGIVKVTADRPATIDLEIPTPIVAKGRVVDGVSGDAIVEATVQPYVAADNSRLAINAPSRRVDEEGRFEFPAMPRGSGAIVVQAKGYAERALSAEIAPDQAHDFGDIGLFRVSSIELQLLLDPEVDATRFSADLSLATYVSERPFSKDRTLRFDELPAGEYDLRVFFPDKSQENRRLSLASSEHVVSRFDLRKGRAFTVEVVNKGAPLPPYCFLFARPGSKAEGEHDFATLIPATNRVRIENFRASSVGLEVDDVNRVPIARAWFKIPEGDEPVLRFEVGAARHFLRVVDTSGAPIRDCSVVVGPADGKHAWSVHQKTGVDGQPILGALPDGPVYVGVYSSGQGSREFPRVELSTRESEPTDLVLEAPARIELLLLDGTDPLFGLAVSLRTLVGDGYLYGTYHTDANGHVRMAPLAEGERDVLVRGPAIWPIEQRIHASPTHTATLQVRQRGSVVLRPRHEGALVTDFAFEIRSVEFAARVAQWVEDKRVTAMPMALHTDSNGALRIDGLPRGVYTWSATLPGQPMTGGQFEVLPRTTTTLDLVL